MLGNSISNQKLSITVALTREIWFLSWVTWVSAVPLYPVCITCIAFPMTRNKWTLCRLRSSRWDTLWQNGSRGQEEMHLFVRLLTEHLFSVRHDLGLGSTRMSKPKSFFSYGNHPATALGPYWGKQLGSGKFSWSRWCLSWIGAHQTKVGRRRKGSPGRSPGC